MKKCDDHKPLHKVEVQLKFCASSLKFKILAIPKVLAHGKSYEHGFMKEITQRSLTLRKIMFRLVIHAPSRKFKILSIPNVLTSGKLYKHDFIKKT
ncbi:hypothetical protein BHM03_00044730 [Ensete ventricosum]|nr:hypothetical protein BHM03_00044730 [Ensete ventricosum]